ncbi:MAG: protein TonB [Limisphaerales bacterium]|jgi:protein TonB
MAVTVTSKDRFNFALFLALSLHALFILGISFSSDANYQESTSIDVTLSLTSDLVAPDEADFIAATNQLGSGTESEAQEMTTTADANFHNNQFAETFSQLDPQLEQSVQEEQQTVTTIAESTTQAPTENETPVEVRETPVTEFNREQLVHEIASLEARIAQEQQALARMPRTKRINSASTRSASEASYLDMWRQKCERIGAINYPAGKIEGQVLILVSILSDGSLEEVRILNSSGHRQLDQAALATVRQAAPFQPFNVEMRKGYDRLEFTRWWQFSKVRNRLSAG